MKIIYYLLLITICIACNFGSAFKDGNGNIVLKEVNVDEFDEIIIGGNYDVKLFPSKHPRVVVEIDENLFEFVKIDVFDEKELHVNSIYSLNPTDGVNIEIYYDQLKSLTSTGASKITHDQLLDTEDFEVDLSGAGAIKLNLRVKDLDLRLSGAGLIKLIGYAEKQKIQLSGAGALEGESLESKYCEVFISGIGNAKVNATKELNANITGLGNIEYFGRPEKISKNVSGLGKVNRGTEYVKKEEGNEEEI